MELSFTSPDPCQQLESNIVFFFFSIFYISFYRLPPSPWGTKADTLFDLAQFCVPDALCDTNLSFIQTWDQQQDTDCGPRPGYEQCGIIFIIIMEKHTES